MIFNKTEKKGLIAIIVLIIAIFIIPKHLLPKHHNMLIVVDDRIDTINTTNNNTTYSYTEQDMTSNLDKRTSNSNLKQSQKISSEQKKPQKAKTPYNQKADKEQNVRTNTEKYPKQTIIVELNSADSLTLVRVRGIGGYYASRILKYRKRLGGFHNLNQLKELKMQYLDIDSISSQIAVNPSLVVKMNMDTMSFKSILKHPYLEYEDVQMIFNAKRKYQHISIDTLSKYGILTDYKITRIKPYFK